MMADPKVLIVFDFDHTLLDCNSDVQIKTLLGNTDLPEKVEKLHNGPEGWIVYMNEIFKYLYEINVMPEDYKRCLSKMPLVEGMKELLLQLHESEDCEIVILSDSNSFFIQYILEYHQLSRTVSSILTHPAEFDEDGCLRVQKLQSKSDCSRCKNNLCKGYILQNFVAQKLVDGIQFYRILYVGDGFNDICPALKLTANDYVFARVGYRLLRGLEKMPARNVKPSIIPWENGHDIKNALLIS